MASNNMKKLWFNNPSKCMFYDVDFHVTLYVFTTLLLYQEMKELKQRCLECNVPQLANHYYWARHIIAPIETIIAEQISWFPKQPTSYEKTI